MYFGSALTTSSAVHGADIYIDTFKSNNVLNVPSSGTNSKNDTDERKIYPNGKTNCVVGYAIKNNGIGYMETAMYKGVPVYE